MKRCQNILDELSTAKFVNHIVIGLDRADEAQYRHAHKFFARLLQKCSILWNEGPPLRSIDAKLTAAGLSPTEPGKGRNVWYCTGNNLASRDSAVVAMHDCDTLTYTKDMLTRLVYPVARLA